MKQFIPASLILGLFLGNTRAADCTLSSQFQLTHTQVLAGVLEDEIPAALPGFKLELVAGGNIKREAVSGNNGEYSFGEVPAGRYRIHIRRSCDPFCAPKVNCNEAGCSIQRQVKLNPKNKPEIVY